MLPSSNAPYNKYVGLIDSRDDRGPPWQRTQDYTAILLLRASHCSGGPLPVKRYIGPMVCWHV